MGPYTDLSDKLRGPYSKLSDKLWGPYTNFSDNRHEDFEVSVKNEVENYVFQTFYHVHRDQEVFFHHICQDNLSLDCPFKEIKKKSDVLPHNWNIVYLKKSEFGNDHFCKGEKDSRLN